MARTRLWYWRLIAGLVALAPVPALAHEKWFTDASNYPLQLGLLFSVPTALAVAAAAGVVGALWVLRRLSQLGETRSAPPGFDRLLDDRYELVGAERFTNVDVLLYERR